MRRIWGPAAILAIASACASTPDAPPAPEVVKAEVYRIEIRDQDFTEFAAFAHVQLPPGVTPTMARWEVLGGSPLVPLASGETEVTADQLSDDGVVLVGGRAPYTADPEALAELLASEATLPVVVRGHLVAGNVHYEFTRAGRVRAPRSPAVSISQVEAASIPSERRISLVFFIRIDNQNAFDVQLENIDYDLQIEGVDIDRGLAGTRRAIPRATAVEVDLPISLDETNFPDVSKHLRGESRLQYRMKGEVRLGVGRIPFDISGPIQVRASGS